MRPPGGEGPPGTENDSGPAPPPGRPGHHDSGATKPPNEDKPNPSRRHCGAETLAGLQRRHGAARRLPPISRCGCIRDPDHDRHRCGDAITETMVDGYRDAVLHLRHLGLLAAPLQPEVQMLWRRGGDDRRLAQELYQLAGGDAA
jgi:hypothetical protein